MDFFLINIHPWLSSLISSVYSSSDWVPLKAGRERKVSLRLLSARNFPFLTIGDIADNSRTICMLFNKNLRTGPFIICPAKRSRKLKRYILTRFTSRSKTPKRGGLQPEVVESVHMTSAVEQKSTVMHHGKSEVLYETLTINWRPTAVHRTCL